MIVRELLTQCRNSLQDYDKQYWDDSELLDYYNEAIRVISYEREGRRETATFALDDNENTYNVNGVIKYISAKDDEGTIRPLVTDNTDENSLDIWVKNNNELYVNDSTIGANIVLQYVGITDAQNIEDSVRIGDEMCIKYFILSRAYEKETDTEDIKKSEMFYVKFIRAKNVILGRSATGDIYDPVYKTDCYFY